MNLFAGSEEKTNRAIIIAIVVMMVVRFVLLVHDFVENNTAFSINNVHNQNEKQKLQK